MNAPLVSIGMPMRNEARHIKVALDTLLAQTFCDFELIISDNDSTDGSGEMCLEYARADARIRYVRNDKNIGMTANQNRAYEMSKGEFFMWGSGNDRWHPEFIARCIDVLRRDPRAVLCYPRVGYIDLDGHELVEPYPCRLDTRGLGVSARANLVIWGLGSCELIYGLYRTSALRSTRLFRNVIAPDNLIIFELSLVGAIAFVDEPLFWMRTPSLEKRHLGDSIHRYRDILYPPERRLFRLWMTNWRLAFEHLAAVARAPLAFNRKITLWMIVLFGMAFRRGKHMMHDILEAMGVKRP